MTDYYVKSGTGGTGGLTWADAMDTVAAAIALGVAAGDRIFVSQSHSEAPSAAITWDVPYSGGTTFILVVDDTGSPEPPLQSDIITTPTVTIDTGTTTTNNLSLYGSFFVSGFIFVTYGTLFMNFESFNSMHYAQYCTFSTAGTSTSKNISIGVGSGSATVTAYWYDCIFKPGHANNRIQAGGSTGRAQLNWIGGSVDTSLATPGQVLTGNILAKLIGLDLSSGNIQFVASNTGGTSACAVGCKMNASYTLESLAAGQELTLNSCSTGSNYFMSAFTTSSGEAETDSGIYLNATYDGTNGYSFNLTSRAGRTTPYRPFRYPLCTIDSVDFSSSKTFTVEFARDGSTTPYQDNEVWIEIEYKDATTSVLSVTDRSSMCAPLETPANLTSSSASWTGLSGTNNKMKVAVTISSASASTGPVRVWVCFDTTTTNTDLYADPAVTVS